MREAVLRIAEEIVLAARTAPKARGYDNLETRVLKDGEIDRLSEKMAEIGKRENNATFLRDSESILKATAVVLLGARKHYLGLRYCGFCGYKDCAACEKAGGICVYVPGDLGIAIGSAVSVAIDHRVDNRVMYSIGLAAVEAGLLGPEAKIAFGIPLSATAKNTFFDRK
ncbi:MAG TPA: DUF2148 domain-containing protein [Candidatus Omnitrophota bacterium]|nr:DUF2148 domain-containing protein [Candidatus Omnitrophota bacterium]